MTSRREQILARIAEIGAEIPGIKTVARDVINRDPEQLPAIAVLEGDEEATEGDVGKGRFPTMPRRVTMLPHVVIIAGNLPENLGAALNDLYDQLIDAVVSDTALLSMVAEQDNRNLRFDGMESELAAGREMFGQMAVKFRITYWRPPVTQPTV